MNNEVAEHYMLSILGQQMPLEISKEDSRQDIFLQLIRVDYLFNSGQSDEAKNLVTEINLPDDSNYKDFLDGLRALLDGSLNSAYDCFVIASRKATGLTAVFFGERAVNIAFWIACSGKMIDAAQDLDVKQAYAGGVLSFAKYMNGHVEEAEQMARTAIADGFQDPWTLHSVAHCLYSQGQSKECTEFLNQYRSLIRQSNPSAFMKGHMEFHQALCWIDLEDVRSLHQLIEGPLWRDLTVEDRKDYWNASGLLNVQWKAELRGLSNSRHKESLEEAMKILMPTASASKSSVFSLCILRWTRGAFRLQWKDQLLKSDNEVLLDLTRATDLIYPTTDQSSEYPEFSDEACVEAWEQHLSKNIDQLHRLGASPEQREVIEEYMIIAGKAAGKGTLPMAEMKNWTTRNYRRNVPFYESFLGLKP
jgi:hypothetical protein